MFGNLLLKVTDSTNYYCGTYTELSVPGKLINIISLIVTLVQVVVPILLIIFGMLDLGKAVMAQKEDEIKKGQQTFIKRVVAAIIVFFVVVVVKLVVGLVASDGKNISNCIDCFVNANTKSCTPTK